MARIDEHNDGCPRIDQLGFIQCGPPWFPLDQVVRIVDPGWTKRICHINDDGPLADVYSLHYPDGTIRIEHRCKALPGDPARQVVCAPALQLSGGHRVVDLAPLTIEPSIACGDCALHGFIRSGRWVPC